MYFGYRLFLLSFVCLFVCYLLSLHQSILVHIFLIYSSPSVLRFSNYSTDSSFVVVIAKLYSWKKISGIQISSENQSSMPPLSLLLTYQGNRNVFHVLTGLYSRTHKSFGTSLVPMFPKKFLSTGNYAGSLSAWVGGEEGQDVVGATLALWRSEP